MKDVIDVYDKIAEAYAEKFPDENEHIEKFLNLLPEGSKILDVGCGHGPDAMLAVKKGFEVVGIDASAKMIEIAKKNCPKGSFKACGIEEMDFESDSFDGIIAAFFLIHIQKKDIPNIMEIFHNILKDDGLIYIALQCGKSHEGYVKEPMLPDEKIFLNIFSLEEVKDIFEKSSFGIIEKFEREPEQEEEFPFTKLFIIAKKV